VAVVGMEAEAAVATRAVATRAVAAVGMPAEVEEVAVLLASAVAQVTRRRGTLAAAAAISPAALITPEQ
jgi:hypothetical protein